MATLTILTPFVTRGTKGNSDHKKDQWQKTFFLFFALRVVIGLNGMPQRMLPNFQLLVREVTKGNVSSFIPGLVEEDRCDFAMTEQYDDSEDDVHVYLGVGVWHYRGFVPKGTRALRRFGEISFNRNRNQC